MGNVISKTGGAYRFVNGGQNEVRLRRKRANECASGPNGSSGAKYQLIPNRP